VLPPGDSNIADVRDWRNLHHSLFPTWVIWKTWLADCVHKKVEAFFDELEAEASSSERSCFG
jgi:hypothetical protein